MQPLEDWDEQGCWQRGCGMHRCLRTPPGRGSLLHIEGFGVGGEPSARAWLLDIS